MHVRMAIPISWNATLKHRIDQALKVDPGSLPQNVDQVAYTKEYALGICE